ncbi:predicted protein [Naegleria gruberi]|uniref:Predicted protein n=1 Tax=Naegleria gruberi TaxID=5762 RepID=D2VFS1_NAEGR|nr:uncharacterized protein NAEGRDRAFT_56166 [Naegleria gruberi]EFC44407.1 predicted protein [Naegleria gruberi]|eukprot:XP_002677151.1 predicted protein [Naegleria gruberi strain NEG-M]
MVNVSSQLKPLIISSKVNPIIKECIKIRTKYSKNFKKCFTFDQPQVFKGEEGIQYKSLPMLMNGSKIIREASEKYKIEPKWLFYSSEQSEIKFKSNDIQYYQTNDNLINHICGDIVSNDGYCAVYDNYNPFKLFENKKKRNVYIYCYKVSDPNNLGSIIRMSFGFDIKAIFLSEDCVSPFTERSIRSSRNYILNIPVFHLPLKDYKTIIYDQLKCKKSLIADASTDRKTPIQNLNDSNEGDVCLIIGNEHHGFCDDDFKSILLPQLENQYEGIYIPMKNNLDSISVSHAASILMFELTKK